MTSARTESPLCPILRPGCVFTRHLSCIMILITIQQAGVKTKYDRMFGRKNQNILSEHYTKLVDHGSDSDDDFITLKRADHALPDDPTAPSPFDPTEPTEVAGTFDSAENLSKRKLKMSKSKKAMLKFKGAPTRLVFDDEGQGHEIYEMRDVDEVFDGEKGALEEGRRFAEEERERLRVVDGMDKKEAREKKRERKRKRKEREREVRSKYTLSTNALHAHDVCRKKKVTLDRRPAHSTTTTMDTSRPTLIFQMRRMRRRMHGLRSICHLRSGERAMRLDMGGRRRRIVWMWRRILRHWRCRSCGEGSRCRAPSVAMSCSPSLQSQPTALPGVSIRLGGGYGIMYASQQSSNRRIVCGQIQYSVHDVGRPNAQSFAGDPPSISAPLESVAPPSSAICAPVTYAPAGLERKSANPAISRGSPMRSVQHCVSCHMG